MFFSGYTFLYVSKINPRIVIVIVSLVLASWIEALIFQHCKQNGQRELLGNRLPDTLSPPRTHVEEGES